MTHNASYWIDQLALRKHPEGGYFRETYRAKESLAASALPRRFSGDRRLSTAIYFLLQGQDVSRFHRIKSDELWHYYAGSALTLHVLDPAGGYTTIRLGPNPEQGELFQACLQAGNWFGATVDDPHSYALVGCTVAPGFDFADFELADRRQLLISHPQHAAIIRRLTP
ncbi:MAG: cupin domain-containing protein [Verrucomicrobia bacterium]|nr:cupin domain-containing protein [Verrucomicrobiota bacterium]MBU4292021.1 cupin domain-containing protein [Verrucomicrobiota bacterium]MBU4427909.1 cupin domain-containing protein [Verrucomicrobiota bacterium]MCG2678855.1 cupin domain-containing protein [Kiritimatiellia bacterium]